MLFVYTVYLCILRMSQKIYRLFPYTVLTGFYNRDGVRFLCGTS
jgi:hypothetical protein